MKSGFTLIELILSLIIIVTISTASLMFVNNSTSLINTNKNIEFIYETELLFNTIENYLQTANTSTIQTGTLLSFTTTNFTQITNIQITNNNSTIYLNNEEVLKDIVSFQTTLFNDAMSIKICNKENICNEKLLLF